MYRNVLDLGAHSFHLVHAQVHEGCIRTRSDHELVVGLAETSFRDGILDTHAWRRGMDAVAGLHRIACETTSPITAVATSAFRDASNGRAFLDAVREKTGLRVELLSEQTEAELSFRGATLGTNELECTVVIDVGRASIELAVGDAAQLYLTRSFPCGVSRLATHLGDDMLLDSSTARSIRQSVHEALMPTIRTVKRLRPDRIVLTSGTSRLLAKLCSNLPGACEIDRLKLAGLIRWIAGRTPAILIEDGVPAARAATLAAGAITVAAVLDLFDVTRVDVAKGGLREGVLVREAATDTVPFRL